MNVYNKVLVELSKTQSFKARRNNLVKLQYSTEDNDLIDLLNSWCEVLNKADILSRCNQPMKLRQLLDDNNYIVDNLRVYCTACVRLQIPEWQILALSNGWRPPLMEEK